MDSDQIVEDDGTILHGTAQISIRRIPLLFRKTMEGTKREQYNSIFEELAENRRFKVSEETVISDVFIIKFFDSEIQIHLVLEATNPLKLFKQH